MAPLAPEPRVYSQNLTFAKGYRTSVRQTNFLLDKMKICRICQAVKQFLHRLQLQMADPYQTAPSDLDIGRTGGNEVPFSLEKNLASSNSVNHPNPRPHDL